MTIPHPKAKSKTGFQKAWMLTAILLALSVTTALAREHKSSSHKPHAHKAQRTPVQVEYTYLGVASQQAWRQQEECLAPLTMVESWGWQITSEPNGRIKLQVDDQSIEVSLRQVEGQDCIFLREAIRLLDGNSEWSTPDKLQITGRVRVIRFVGHHLKVSSSLPIFPQVIQPNGNGLAHIELTGATLSQDAILDVEPKVAVSTTSPNHLGIDFPAAHKFVVTNEAIQPGKELDIDSSLAAATSGDNLALTHETEQGLTLNLTGNNRLSGPIRVVRPDPTTLRLFLPGVQLGETPTVASTSSIAQIQANTTDSGTHLVIQFRKPMGIIVSQPKGHLQISLVKPDSDSPALANQLIVVDAGHGGKDTGATHWESGLAEKELTLPVAKKLAVDLAAEGAAIIMPRNADEFITLEERAAIANRNHANLFLCVHINSNGADRKTSGTITFFHGHNETSLQLARCIQSQIALVSGIPSIGCWSDFKIYPGVGFSVLRNTTMPGVLIELGFINNDHDRPQLVRDDIQAAMAAAVVKGVKTYLGVTDHATN